MFVEFEVTTHVARCPLLPFDPFDLSMPQHVAQQLTALGCLSLTCILEDDSMEAVASLVEVELVVFGEEVGFA